MAVRFAKLFHKQVREEFEKYLLSEQRSDIIQNPDENPLDWDTILFKEYTRMPQITLPENLIPLGNLDLLLHKRKSTRNFTDNPLSKEELSTLLYYSAGINHMTKTISKTQGTWSNSRRFYPSGGARYPLEVYLGIKDIKGVERGIYHYNIKKHCLEKLLGTEGAQQLFTLLSNEKFSYPWSSNAPITYIITSVWDRNFNKYQDFGYRIILMEAGHMCQNLLLVATSLGIKNCPLTGFSNSKLEKILDIDPEAESTLYIAALGK